MATRPGQAPGATEGAGQGAGCTEEGRPALSSRSASNSVALPSGTEGTQPGHEVARTNSRRRLEQLEALLQREQAGLDDVLQGERPEALSAIARARQAKATIAKGKQLEASDLAAAVQTYETALKYIEAPHHLAKLQERIDKLKAELAADDKMDFEVISVSAPPTFVSDGKENSPNRMTVNNGRIVISKTLDVVSTLEASLLKTLNEGSEADLLELNGIGKKRAESIVSWRQGGNLFDSISDLRKIDGFSKNFAATFFKRNATDRIDFGS